MTRLVASFLGTGLVLGRVRGSDSGSGTLGGAVAAVAAFAIGSAWGWPWVAVGAAVLAVAGWWSAGRLHHETGDAGWIVVDEAAGAFLSLVGLATWPAALVAFVVFRFADIAKSWFPGVAAGERLPGASGIMADDLVAGLYGLVVGHVVQALL
jgi:phosphatidylglycerophosphatase A